MRRSYLVCVVLFVTLAGCGDGSSAAAGSTGAAGGSSSASGSSGSSSGGADDGCVKAGGMCGCAGSCNPGYHPATGALLDACPQPCAQCGACGQQCCLPDEDAGSDGGDGG